MNGNSETPAHIRTMPRSTSGASRSGAAAVVYCTVGVPGIGSIGLPTRGRLRVPRLAHDLVGDAVCLLFERVVGRADDQRCGLLGRCERHAGEAPGDPLVCG